MNNIRLVHPPEKKNTTFVDRFTEGSDRHGTSPVLELE